MSAYLMSDKEISVIANALPDYGLSIDGVEFDSMAWVLINERYQPLGQALLDQNSKSVNYRYGEDTPALKFNYVDVDGNYTMGELLGCIECYEYQACETPDYFNSNIHKALTQLKEEMLKRLIRNRGEEITWGLH